MIGWCENWNIEKKTVKKVYSRIKKINIGNFLFWKIGNDAFV